MSSDIPRKRHVILMRRLRDHRFSLLNLLLLCGISSMLGVFVYHLSHPRLELAALKYAHPTKPIPTFKTRGQLAAILNSEKLEIGAELGVQRGIFSKRNLVTWKTCKKYVLVDLWANQANYNDSANFDNAKHQQLKRVTLENLAPYKSKLVICQNYTTVCARRFEMNTFDFIYVDARHDYKGVMQDLETWYPLLKPGGIFAGHDYVTNNDGPRQHGQDWSLNYDGTRDPTGRAVKGAVDDFADKYGLHLGVSYRERGFNTWAARKPY